MAGMANPQLENGFFKISNELWDAICRVRIPGQARQVFDVIIRKTYGYGKKEDCIPLSQICISTGLRKQHAQRGLDALVEMNMITRTVTELGYAKNKYMINKDFETWKPYPKKVTYPNTVTKVTKLGYNRNPKRVHQNTKDNTKDILRDSAQSASPAKSFLQEFGKLFQERFGTTYVCSFKKDTVLVKDMIAAIGYDELVRRAKLFFRDEDEFVKRAGYKIGTFKSRVNSYVIPKPKTVKYAQPNLALSPEEEAAAIAARQRAFEEARQKGLMKNAPHNS